MRPCPNCQNSAFEPMYNVHLFSVVRCRQCSLVFLGNPPDEDTLYEHYHENTHIDFSEYTTHSRNSHIAELYAINEQRVNQILQLKPSGKLLDIGCGRGYFLKTAANHGFDVHGIDISGTAVQYASEKFLLRATCETLDDLLRSSKRYDIITLWHVLEHFLDPYTYLSKVNKLLNDLGICVIEVPNLRSLKFMLSRQKWKGGNHPLYHRTFFTSKTLQNALMRTGFSQFKRIRLSYSIPDRNHAYEILKSGLNVFALDAFLNFIAFK